MRVLFMGTPGIAAAVLQALAGYSEVCGVFCQPDKPVGRKGVLTPPPVKVAAQAIGVPVYQPAKLRDGQAMSIIEELRPDLIVVVAYGKILPKEILAYPKHGCINVHVSLLPQYRGAAPIQHALLNGDTQTGVTVMYMDEGLDTGDIIMSAAFPIADSDDADTLFEKASQHGIVLLKQVIYNIENGDVTRTPQDHARATFAPPLTKDIGLFTWTNDARSICNKARALVQWPVAYFVWKDKKIKVHTVAYVEAKGVPGAILSSDPLTVAATGGAVRLLEVTPQGSRRMRGGEFAAGQRLKPDDSLLR